MARSGLVFVDRADLSSAASGAEAWEWVQAALRQRLPPGAVLLVDDVAIYRPPASRPDALGAAVWNPDGGAGKPTVALLPKAIPEDFLNDWRVREDGENLEKFETWLEREKYTEDAVDVYLCRWAYSQTFDI